MAKICQRYAKDMPKTHQRYIKDMPGVITRLKILDNYLKQRYAKRYDKDMQKTTIYSSC